MKMILFTIFTISSQFFLTIEIISKIILVQIHFYCFPILHGGGWGSQSAIGIFPIFQHYRETVEMDLNLGHFHLRWLNLKGI